MQCYDTFLSCQLTLSGNIERCVRTVKLVLSGHQKRPKIGFQDRLSLNAGQNYCRMLIKLPFVVKTFVLSIFEWPFVTRFTVIPRKYMQTDRQAGRQVGR